MNKTYNENYELYYDKDLIVCPLLGKSPHVCGKDWQLKTFNKSQSIGNNIGLITGERSGVICIDIDTTDEALKQKIYKLLPPLYCGKIGNKNKGTNYFFKYNGEKNRKIGGVVELLSTGNMTVLPPSIHPDFDYKYEWVGKSLLEIDIDNLCDLPPDFINEVTKLLPEKETPFTSEGRHNKLINICGGKIEEGVDPTTAIQEIINYDNQNHTPPYFTDATEQHGGKGYETAFKMYMSVADTVLRKGNFTSPTPQITIGEIKKYKKDYKKLPKLEGIGKVIFDDLYNNSPIPRSQLCFMNTMNLLSILIGNKLYHRGTACNLYQYGIAPSGYGKDFSFKRSKQIIIDAGLEKLIGSTSPTSESVILATLEKNREKVMFVNEAESLLKRISDDRKNNGLRECLTDLYDYGGKMHSPKLTMAAIKKDGQKTDEIGHVFSPFINILMTSTTSGFENYASGDIFNTGFGMRFLFYFEDRFKDEKFLETYNPPINENLLKAVKILGNNFQQIIDMNPMKTPFEIDHAFISDEGEKIYKKIFAEIGKEKRKYKNSNFLGLISRKLYFINKFTTIHHVMINPTDYVKTPITPASYLWAQNAIDSIVHNMIQNLDNTVSESPYGRKSNEILKYIKGRTEKKQGTSNKDISNRFRSTLPDIRKKVITDLLSMGQIVTTESKDFFCVIQ